MRNPRRITPTPTRVTVLSPGPEPVNARELDEAVTTLVGGGVVPLVPEVLGGWVLAVAVGVVVEEVAD